MPIAEAQATRLAALEDALMRMLARLDKVESHAGAPHMLCTLCTCPVYHPLEDLLQELESPIAFLFPQLHADEQAGIAAIIHRR